MDMSSFKAIKGLFVLTAFGTFACVVLLVEDMRLLLASSQLMYNTSKHPHTTMQNVGTICPNRQDQTLEQLKASKDLLQNSERIIKTAPESPENQTSDLKPTPHSAASSRQEKFEMLTGKIPCSSVSDDGGLDCSPGKPCVYEDEVDLRVIVMVYDRADSLAKSLDHLQYLELDCAAAKMEIWIDCSAGGYVNKATYEVATNYTWKLGSSRVHVWKSHVGIYGQFTDTWGTRVGTREAAIFVEDDVDVAPMAWRWLRAAREKYNHVTKIAGFGIRQKSLPDKTQEFLGNSTVSLKRYVESWGFAPKAEVYSHFQSWFHEVRRNKKFRPILREDPMRTRWFQNSERAESMWSMWFHYYLKMKDIYMMYPNFKALTGEPEKTLCFNRKEKGLHFGGDNKEHLKTEQLLDFWNNSFVEFPDDIKILNYDTSYYNTLHVKDYAKTKT